MERVIYLAGGCFWGIEHLMRAMPGVIDTEAGYANGSTEADATYERVCKGHTGFRECVRVVYDDRVSTLDKLLFAFYAVIDASAVNRQGNDVGTQYQAGIYWTPGDTETQSTVLAVSEVEKARTPGFAVELSPLRNFYPAEDYHQDYLVKNPGGYCHVPANVIKLLTAVGTDPGRWRKPSDEALRERLDPLQYDVTQNAATEAPYDNAYWRTDRPGIYVDIATGEPLFSSADKYRSSCGWPAFSNAIDPAAMVSMLDESHGMRRIEVRSRAGNSHLGHIFTGDPESPTGTRFCINSAAIRFVPLEDMEAQGYGDLVPYVEQGR